MNSLLPPGTAAVCLHHFEGGVFRASMGIDLAVHRRAPGHELAHAQGDADCRMTLPLQTALSLLERGNELGIAVVERVTVFHRGFGGVPLRLAEPRQPETLKIGRRRHE